MLNDNPDELQGYISKTKDAELISWWGQYLESCGDINTALQFYEVRSAMCSVECSISDEDDVLISRLFQS